MSISELFSLVGTVITSAEVIVALLALFIFVKIANGICNYRKRPKKKQEKLFAKAKPTQNTTASDTDEETYSEEE